MITITSGAYRFTARLQTGAAPRTVARFHELLPYRERIVHVRWSGEACWIPLGDFPSNLTHENATAYPAPGQILFYPGGFSETEILIAYGPTHFASRMGTLAGNHFATIETGLDQLAELGRKTLWDGAQPIVFEA
jgi:hypothetical protein